MNLEIQHRKARGLGFTREVWPKAKHNIVRIGRIEARVIESICDTGARSGPVYEHYKAHGRLPAPEPMFADATP